MFVNLTPHAICLNDGTSFEPTGTIARVSASFSEFDGNGICRQVYGEISGLPPAIDGTWYIVSGLVLSAAKESLSHRTDLVAPATGHSLCVRNEKGHIVSVPGFVR